MTFNEELSIDIQNYIYSLTGKRQKSIYLFPNPQGLRLTDESIGNIVKKIKKECGFVQKITPHTFRRAFATNLYYEGHSILRISKRMGHASIKTT